jgi:Fe-S-cluster containining protein
VADNLPITVGDGSKGAVDSCDICAEVIGLELHILGKPVNLHFFVRQEQARLTDIVPLAQAVCTKITDAVFESIRSDGGRIPCHRGCSACCSSLVPLSVPEAFRLRKVILAMPEPHRQLTEQSCLLVAQRILKRKPPQQFVERTKGAPPNSLAKSNIVASWYRNLNLACPFHYKGVCTIYEKRPLACREHFVKGSARACRGKRGTAEEVEIPVRMVDALAQLASELEDTGIEAVMLPLMLVRHEENPQRAERTWPAAMMARRFVEIVKIMASKNSTKLIAQTEPEQQVIVRTL